MLFIDNDGLVEKHVEYWDITVLDAFISTLFPFLKFGAMPALTSSYNNKIQ